MARFSGGSIASGTPGGIAPQPQGTVVQPVSEGSDLDYDDPFTQWLVPKNERRIMVANRVTGVFQPGPSYANTDPQKGGAPGDPGTVEGSTSGGISSQDAKGNTVMAGVPNSPVKLSFGESDYSSFYPTAVAAHGNLNANANPNRPQVNPTPFNPEGPSANTLYSTPAPWAAGTFLG